MVHLAKRFKAKKMVPLKDIAKTEAISFDFLEKILLELEKSKLIKSKKGFGGGYILAKSPSKITAKEIIDPLENTIAVDCSLCGKNKNCISKNVWHKIDSAVDKTLKSIKLSTLIK